MTWKNKGKTRRVTVPDNWYFVSGRSSSADFCADFDVSFGTDFDFDFNVDGLP